MKINIKIITGLMLFLPLIFTSCSTEEKVEKYPYQEVENDPLQTRIYTLDNGLKVYLSVNRDEPRVQTNIAVRAGSKYDPAETTGLAHYLEHMLFKGNSKIASLDWENETTGSSFAVNLTGQSRIDFAGLYANGGKIHGSEIFDGDWIPEMVRLNILKVIKEN